MTRERVITDTILAYLEESIDEFRLGHDLDAMNLFVEWIQVLQCMLQYNRCCRKFDVNHKMLFLQLHSLLEDMKQDNITEFVDILEYDIKPLLETSLKGGKNDEDSKTK